MPQTLGMRSSWVAEKLKPVQNRYGIYIADHKIEAIVNDCNRLNINAYVIEPNPVFRDYAILAMADADKLHVVEKNSLIKPDLSYLPKEIFSLVSFGTLSNCWFESNDVVRSMLQVYKNSFERLTPLSVVQFKSYKHIPFDTYVFTRFIDAMLGNYIEDETIIDLKHQQAELYLYFINKGVKE